jgi:hypothetical protein
MLFSPPTITDCLAPPISLFIPATIAFASPPIISWFCPPKNALYEGEVSNEPVVKLLLLPANIALNEPPSIS